jgi:hypothetical protein
LASNFRRNLRRASHQAVSIERGSSIELVKRFFSMQLQSRRRLGLPPLKVAVRGKNFLGKFEEAPRLSARREPDIGGSCTDPAFANSGHRHRITCPQRESSKRKGARLAISALSSADGPWVSPVEKQKRKYASSQLLNVQSASNLRLNGGESWI